MNGFDTPPCCACVRPHPADTDGNPTVGLTTPDLALEHTPTPSHPLPAVPPSPAGPHGAGHPAGPARAHYRGAPGWDAADAWSEPGAQWHATEQARNWVDNWHWPAPWHGAAQARDDR